MSNWQSSTMFRGVANEMVKEMSMTPKQRLIEAITKRQIEYDEIAKHMDAETTLAYADGKIDGLDGCLQFIKEILPE